MAESLPAKPRCEAGLGSSPGWGALGGSLGPLYWGLALSVWGVESFFWIVLVEVGVLAAVVAPRPRVPQTGS